MSLHPSSCHVPRRISGRSCSQELNSCRNHLRSNAICSKNPEAPTATQAPSSSRSVTVQGAACARDVSVRRSRIDSRGERRVWRALAVQQQLMNAQAVSSELDRDQRDVDGFLSRPPVRSERKRNPEDAAGARDVVDAERPALPFDALARN